MKEVKSKNLALITSLLFLAATALSFYWLWQNAQPSADSSILDEKYHLIDISTEKSKAEELVKGKENFTHMPIQTPSDSGRVNPFAGL